MDFTCTPVVLIACPLQSIINKQITYLTCVGMKAGNIGDKSYNDNVVAGKISIIFVSPESLGSEACQKLFAMPFYKANILALICDEVHTVTQW